MFATKIGAVARSFSTSVVRQSGHGGRPYPGSNLPFGIENRYKLTAVMIVYLGSAFGFPFWVLHRRHT